MAAAGGGSGIARQRARPAAGHVASPCADRGEPTPDRILEPVTDRDLAASEPPVADAPAIAARAEASAARPRGADAVAGPGTAPEPTVPARSPAATGSPVAAPLDGPTLPVIALVQTVLAHDRFRAAATALCTDLALATGALRVALGWLSRGRTRVLALSNTGTVPMDDAARLTAGAMDEAIDQSSTVWSPSLEPARRVAFSQELLRRESGGAVLTVPLPHDGEAIGALTFTFADARPPTRAQIAWAEDAARLSAPLLRLLHERDRPVLLTLAARALGQFRDARHARPLRIAAALGTAVLLAGAFVPIDSSISAPSRIEGEVQRIVASPTKGYLKSVLARPGDRVKAGQVIAELGERDLELERSKLRSEHAQHEGSLSAALARGDRAAMAIAQSKMDEARAQLSLIEQQLERVQLQSPIDGVLIQGDLAQSVNAPVERGQALFTIAPVDRYRVIVELDERDLRGVHVGQRGRLALSALPWDTIDLEVLRVAPMATMVEGRNVFELETRPAAAPASLRPGLRGVAHLDAGRRPLFAVWGERLLDAARRLTWRWQP